MTIDSSHINALESEAIHILREIHALCDNPVLLFSGGKDSIVLTHLLERAFYPSKIPFPILHIDTGHNFEETIQFRDKLVKEKGLRLLTGDVEAYIESGELEEEEGYGASRNLLQTHVLLDIIEQNNFDAAIGGGRRDEEKSRSKERIFSHRNSFGQWMPRNQRPELWQLFNARKKSGEHFRIFPLSNWTEMDIWHFIHYNKIDIPNIYYAHERIVFSRKGMLLSYASCNAMKNNEKAEKMVVRCRTIGDMTNTGLIKSNAGHSAAVIAELMESDFSERGRRADDRRSESSLEERKKEGYF